MFVFLTHGQYIFIDIRTENLANDKQERFLFCRSPTNVLSLTVKEIIPCQMPNSMKIYTCNYLEKNVHLIQNFPEKTRTVLK